MNPEPTLDRLDQLLADERAAIRRLDATRVSDLADEKLALIADLRQAALHGRAELAPRLQALTAGLRRNAVLMAHARDILHDVVTVATGTPADLPLSSTRPASATPTRISLRG